MSHATQRRVHARWEVRGILETTAPTLVGGEADNLSDNPVLRNHLDQPMLSGEGIAGALRSYLLDQEWGFRQQKEMARAFNLLGFVPTNQDRQGYQSQLIVYDAHCLGKSAIELRDGIHLNPSTGLVEEDFKFELEVLPAGSRFGLWFELVVADPPAGLPLGEYGEAAQVQTLYWLLRGFELGQVRLGRYKHKGFGSCEVKQWMIERHDLSTLKGIESFAKRPYPNTHPYPKAFEADKSKRTEGNQGEAHKTLKDLFGRAKPDVAVQDFPQPQGNLAVFTVQLKQTGGLLNGSSPGVAGKNHLQSGGRDVISGRSLFGALRSRSNRIVNTLDLKTVSLEGMFGSPVQKGGKDLVAGRVRISEPILGAKPTRLYTTRVAIDSFTGGSSDGLLFSETVVYGGSATLKLELLEPSRAEIGLMLLVLRDLVTEDLALGGTVGIGRGRFVGEFELRTEDQTLHWSAEQSKDTPKLTPYIKAFLGEA